jgi:zinc transport system substrate-binding protein
MNLRDKMKRIKIITLLIITATLLTGCTIKKDSMDNIKVLTTTYPITYLATELYGTNSTVTSIYPNGIDINTYELTDKQLDEYAKSSLFVYNGLSNTERELAKTLLNKNSNIKLIDVSNGMQITNDMEELWLVPANYLMLAKNLDAGLNQYVTSTKIKTTIETNYENLKLTISTYDADLKLIAENATNKNIIAGNDIFKFLDKYGFTVLSVEENETFNHTDYANAKKYIRNKSVSNVFILDTDSSSTNVDTLKSLGATVVPVRSMTIRTDDEVKNNTTYETMMKAFIESIRNEAYK